MLEHAHSRAAVAPTTIPASALHADARTAAWEGIARAAISGVVLLYLATVLVAPLVALASELTRVGLRAALNALLQPNALFALRMSLVLAAIAVTVNAVLGTLGALVIVRHRFIGRAWLSALADLPLAISPVMIGLSFLLLLGREGWLTPLFDHFGIKIMFAFPGLLIATLFVALPYTLREIVYVLEEIGTSEEEAAATLGASPWQIFWRVTLPNIRFGLAYGVLMTLSRSLGEFGAVLVLGGSISGQTQTATTFIHDAIEERQSAGAYGMAAVLAFTSVALLLTLSWAKRRRQAS